MQQTEIAVTDIQTNKELLQKYIDIDNEVRELESKQTLKKFTELQTENSALKEGITSLEAVYTAAKEKTYVYINIY